MRLLHVYQLSASVMDVVETLASDDSPALLARHTPGWLYLILRSIIFSGSTEGGLLVVRMFPAFLMTVKVCSTGLSVLLRDVSL